MLHSERGKIILVAALLLALFFRVISVYAQQLPKPRDPEVIELLKLLGRQRTTGRAPIVEEFRRYVDSHPSNPDNIFLEYEAALLYSFHYCEATGEKPDPQKAIETFGVMFQKYPPAHPIILDSKLRCSALLRRRDAERGKQLCQEVLNHIDELPDPLDRDLYMLRAHFELGCLAQAQKNLAASRSHFEKVLNFDRADIPRGYLMDFCTVRDNSAIGLIHLHLLLEDSLMQLAYLKEIAPLVAIPAGDIGPAEVFNMVYQELVERMRGELQEEAEDFSATLLKEMLEWKPQEKLAEASPAEHSTAQISPTPPTQAPVVAQVRPPSRVGRTIVISICIVAAVAGVILFIRKRRLITRE